MFFPHQLGPQYQATMLAARQAASNELQGPQQTPVAKAGPASATLAGTHQLQQAPTQGYFPKQDQTLNQAATPQAEMTAQ